MRSSCEHSRMRILFFISPLSPNANRMWNSWKSVTSNPHGPCRVVGEMNSVYMRKLLSRRSNETRSWLDSVNLMHAKLSLRVCAAVRHPCSPVAMLSQQTLTNNTKTRLSSNIPPHMEQPSVQQATPCWTTFAGDYWRSTLCCATINQSCYHPVSRAPRIAYDHMMKFWNNCGYTLVFFYNINESNLFL